MNFATEIQAIIESIYSPSISFLYADSAEANLKLDSIEYPCCLLHQFAISKTRDEGCAIVIPKIVTLEFLDRPDQYRAYAITNESIIDSMEQLAVQFIDYIQSGNSTKFAQNDLADAQLERMNEGKFNVGAIGTAVTLELSPMRGYVNTNNCANIII